MKPPRFLPSPPETQAQHSAQVEDCVLSVINDGDGSLCGMTYAQRCAAADTGIFQYRAACQRYGQATYPGGDWHRVDTINAATRVQAYYRQHTAEVARVKKQEGRI